MTARNKHLRAIAAESAADWCVTNEDGPLSALERAELLEWLKASSNHVEEYLGVAVLARDLATVAGESTDSIEALVAEARADLPDNVVALPPAGSAPSTPAVGTRLPGTRWFAAAAAVFLAVAVSWMWQSRDGERFGLPKAYRTAHGEQGTWQLPDASVLQLNTDTAVTVRYTRVERVVTVDRGEAFLRVAKDHTRPFRTHAGDSNVVAVGTQFDVYRQPEATVVTVVEGQVAVFADGALLRAPLAEVAARALHVSAGEQVRMGAGPLPAHATAVDLRLAVGWLHRQIVFERQALGEVAREFNRYASMPVNVSDRSLAAMPISGVFDPYDTESLAAFLATLDGVTVQRSPTGIRVVRTSQPHAGAPPAGQ